MAIRKRNRLRRRQREAVSLRSFSAAVTRKLKHPCLRKDLRSLRCRLNVLISHLRSRRRRSKILNVRTIKDRILRQLRP